MAQTWSTRIGESGNLLFFSHLGVCIATGGLRLPQPRCVRRVEGAKVFFPEEMPASWSNKSETVELAEVSEFEDPPADDQRFRSSCSRCFAEGHSAARME